MNPLWSESTQILQRLPDILTPEDRARIPANDDVESVVRFLEAMNARYENHPYFTAQLAMRMEALGATVISARLLRQTKQSLERLGIEDQVLSETVERYTKAAHHQSQVQYLRSLTLPYFRRWVDSREHRFPLNHPFPPTGHEQIKEAWASLISQSPDRQRQYLNQIAVDTNHIESTFFISDDSIRDIFRQGIDGAHISALPNSPLHDPGIIRNILKDTVSAYDVLFELVLDPQKLSREKICDAQRRLMDTCRFQDLSHGRYIVPGETRTATGATVMIIGPGIIQFCPYTKVDEEVDFICHMAKQYIRTWTRNPFATASWLHYLLANCHPFDDGNGRTCRLIASIPLVLGGYPPMNINLTLQSGYYAAIRKAHDGDHTPLIQCLLDGMRATVESIQAASKTL